MYFPLCHTLRSCRALKVAQIVRWASHDHQEFAKAKWKLLATGADTETPARTHPNKTVSVSRSFYFILYVFKRICHSRRLFPLSIAVLVSSFGVHGMGALHTRHQRARPRPRRIGGFAPERAEILDNAPLGGTSVHHVHHVHQSPSSVEPCPMPKLS